MKKAHRKREIAARDIVNWDEVRAYIATQFEKLVALQQRQYGHLFKTSWWYESEWCPCCGQKAVGMWAGRDGQASLSLNGFVYHERQVLIGYLLCRLCAEDLSVTSHKRQVEMHRRIEARLMAAYQQAFDEASTSDGVAGIVD